MRTLLGLTLLAGALWAADMTPLNVKLGEWETTTRIQMPGLPGIPQETLDKMPPQQRAMIEERMKAMQNRPTVTKTCLKQEDLDKANTFGAPDKACTYTVVTSSATRREIRIECDRRTGKQTGTVVVERADSEHIKGNVRMNMEQADRTMAVSSSYESKWLGPVCSAKRQIGPARAAPAPESPRHRLAGRRRRNSFRFSNRAGWPALGRTPRRTRAGFE